MLAPVVGLTREHSRYGGDSLQGRPMVARVSQPPFLVREELASLERVTGLELLMVRLPELVGSPLSVNALREDLLVSHATVANWLAILDAAQTSGATRSGWWTLRWCRSGVARGSARRTPSADGPLRDGQQAPDHPRGGLT
jgi:hypothetical protein